MTEGELAGYCAAILIHHAKATGGLISSPRSEIDTILTDLLGFQVSESVSRLTVQILNRCDIAYQEDDPITGVFTRVSYDNFKGFVEGVNQDRLKYGKIVDEAEDEVAGLNRAEQTSFRHLDAYNQHSAIRKYSQFGDEWILNVLDRLKDGSFANLVAPASDRVVLLSDNQDKVEDIRGQAANLRAQLESGNDVGALTETEVAAAIGEVMQIEAAFAGKAVRANVAYESASATLTWIGQQAAGALVGAAALTLLALIAKLLGF